MNFTDPFILQIFAIAALVAFIAGSLGCFVVWKKMSYYSDALSHSALLGVAIGLGLGIGITSGLFILVLIFSVLLVVLKQSKLFSNDNILGILSHLSLALGVVLLGIMDVQSIDLLSYLFGDILTSTTMDLYLLGLVAVLVIGTLLFYWQPLLLLILNEDLARAEGIKAGWYQLIFMILIAISVVVSVQIVGALLITALLIIPPAIARLWSHDAKIMFINSIIIAIICAIIGVMFSIYYDIPTSPTIVLVLGAVFFVNQGLMPFSRNSNK